MKNYWYSCRDDEEHHVCIVRKTGVSIMVFFFLLLLSITLFTKIHNTLLTLLKSQSDIFPQNRKEKRERKTTYNGLSTELNKGITEIVQKKKKNNVYSGRTQKP